MFMAPGSSRTITLSENDLHILLPVSGAIKLSSGAEDKYAAAEEMFLYCTAQNEQLIIHNPFDDIKTNLLHITIGKQAHNIPADTRQSATINITEKNKMFSGSGISDCISIGVYDSRVKNKVLLQPGNNAVCSHVVNGSFDLEERLLEYRDTLYQWDIQEIDLEALSETAIILLIECSLTK